jgi:hypothetical protein
LWKAAIDPRALDVHAVEAVKSGQNKKLRPVPDGEASAAKEGVIVPRKAEYQQMGTSQQLVQFIKGVHGK